MKKRKEVAVKNNPGIYKLFNFLNGKWVDSGKIISTRRKLVNGKPRREKAFFKSLSDAKDYRAGLIDKQDAQNTAHRVTIEQSEALTFEKLIERWKSFHFLKLENSSQRFYLRKLPYFKYLNSFEVDKITVSTIDNLVEDWVSTCSRTHGRKNFERELTVLTVIFNYYRERLNRNYQVPVIKDHYLASTIIKSAKKDEVEALCESDLIEFLEDLKKGQNPQYYFMALEQFGLSLRIGEACALMPDVIDFKNDIVRVSRTIVWNDDTWEPELKEYPKDKEPRPVAIPKFLKPILVKLVEDCIADGRTFLLEAKRGKSLKMPDGREVIPLCRRIVSRQYNRVLKRLGINYVSGTHMLRRTSATLANEETGDFFSVSKQLGHSSVEVTKRYVKHTSKAQHKVAKALDSVFQREMGSREKAENHAA